MECKSSTWGLVSHYLGGGGAPPSAFQAPGIFISKCQHDLELSCFACFPFSPDHSLVSVTNPNSKGWTEIHRSTQKPTTSPGRKGFVQLLNQDSSLSSPPAAPDLEATAPAPTPTTSGVSAVSCRRRPRQRVSRKTSLSSQNALFRNPSYFLLRSDCYTCCNILMPHYFHKGTTTVIFKHPARPVRFDESNGRLV